MKTIKQLVDEHMHEIASMQRYGDDIQDERRRILTILWDMNRMFDALPDNIKKIEVHDHD